MIETCNRQPKAWEKNLKREFLWEIRAFTSACVRLGNLENHTKIQGRIGVQERPKTLISHTWLISRLNKGRK